jgi:hypothetical protein
MSWKRPSPTSQPHGMHELIPSIIDTTARRQLHGPRGLRGFALPLAHRTKTIWLALVALLKVSTGQGTTTSDASTTRRRYQNADRRVYSCTGFSRGETWYCRQHCVCWGTVTASTWPEHSRIHQQSHRPDYAQDSRQKVRTSDRRQDFETCEVPGRI